MWNGGYCQIIGNVFHVQQWRWVRWLFIFIYKLYCHCKQHQLQHNQVKDWSFKWHMQTLYVFISINWFFCITKSDIVVPTLLVGNQNYQLQNKSINREIRKCISKYTSAYRKHYLSKEYASNMKLPSPKIWNDKTGNQYNYRKSTVEEPTDNI